LGLALEAQEVILVLLLEGLEIQVILEVLQLFLVIPGPAARSVMEARVELMVVLEILEHKEIL
jgi:hypothetical protein